jgi:hypothetical protein
MPFNTPRLAADSSIFIVDVLAQSRYPDSYRDLYYTKSKRFILVTTISSFAEAV